DGDRFLPLDSNGDLDRLEADVGVEAAGTPDSIMTALRCAGRGARVVIVGSGRTLERSGAWASRLHDKDLAIIGAHLTAVSDREATAMRWSYQQEAALFLDLIRRNRLRVDDLITWRAQPVECNVVYEHLATGRSKHLGIVFRWREDQPAACREALAPAAAASVPRRSIKPATAVKPLQIALVGLGGIGQQHAKEAARASLVKVVGVYDTNQKVSLKLGAALDAK